MMKSTLKNCNLLGCFTSEKSRRVLVLGAMLAGSLSLQAQPEQKVQDAILADALKDSAAYDYLGRLCDDFGGRLTGSPYNWAAMERTIEELKALGVEARLEKFKMPVMVRSEDDAVTMLTPIERKLRVAALSYNVPNHTFEAEVVDIGQGRDEDLKDRDVKGKIGLLDANTSVPRGMYEAAAVKYGMKGVLFTNRVDGGQLLARTGGFMGEPLKIPVYSITQEEGLWMKRLLVRKQPVRLRMTMKSERVEVETANIVATFPGRTADKIIVGAHFDSWDLGQGAMDNGLGTAQLFGLAKVLKAHAEKNLRTIELIWFNGEEQGLWGSRHQAPLSRGEPVAAMVNLDMVGYPLSVNALGATSLVPVLQRYADSMPKERLRDGVNDINWLGSDHTPYQMEGIPSITYGALIDRSINRYYHDFADTFDKADPKMIAESTATIAVLAYRLANEENLSTKRATPEEIEAMFTRFGLGARMRSTGLWPAEETKK